MTYTLVQSKQGLITLKTGLSLITLVDLLVLALTKDCELFGIGREVETDYRALKDGIELSRHEYSLVALQVVSRQALTLSELERKGDPGIGPSDGWIQDLFPRVTRIFDSVNDLL